MNERFEKAAGLLPAALNVVLCKPEAVVDDTCLSRLLSWFETAFNCQDKAELLLSVIGDFVWKVCAEGKHPVAIAFGLKVSTVSDDVNALCWKSCLRWIADERLLEHSQAAVRCAAYDVLSNLTHIPDAVSLLGETDLVTVSLKGLDDNSMFVSKAACTFLCNWLHFSGALHQPSSDIKNHSTTSPHSGVPTVLDHFKSLFQSSSSSVEHITGSVFAIAEHLMEVFPSTARSFIVDSELLQLADVVVVKGDRNVCQAVVDFLRTLVTAGRGLDLCWSNLLPHAHTYATVEDDLLVVQDWLIKHPIVLLQREFSQLGLMCLSSYLDNNGLFNSSHWHNVIANMMMYPLSVVLGQTTTAQHLRITSQDDASRQLSSAIEELLKTKHHCVSVICTCLSLTNVLMSHGCCVDLPVGLWCGNACTVLKISLGISLTQETCLTEYAYHLIGSHKVAQSVLRSLQDFMNAELLCQHHYNCVVEVLLDILQIPSLPPKVISMVLNLLVAGLLKLREPKDQWIGKVSQTTAELLVSPHWEIRDSVLESIASILEACQSPSLFGSCVSLAVWRSLSDSESYVRASALRALGQITFYDELLSPLLLALNLTPDDVVKTVCSIAEDDTEAFARRSAVQLLSTWLDNPKFDDCLLFSHGNNVTVPCQVVQKLLHVAIGDLDWEVKLQALGFWEKLLESDRFDSQETAIRLLGMSGAGKDLMAAAQDHDKAVKQKSTTILKYVCNRIPSCKHRIELMERVVQDFSLELSSINLHEEEQDDDDGDSDAYSMLQDILACADEAISSDCKLLDCY